MIRPAPARTLGVLGGMGALATVEFLRLLVEATPAETDQDQIPLLVRFCPEVPDRVAALRGDGPSPAPAPAAAARALQAAGAEALAMPCNTAHAWFDDLAAAVSIPVLHIVDTAVAAARVAAGPSDRGAIGLLATDGTRLAGLYAQRSGAGVHWLEPDDAEQARCVTPAIRAVKLGRLDEAAALLRPALDALAARGARAIVLGCTELPLARPGDGAPVPVIDSSAALAAAAVDWALGAPGRG